MSRISKSKRLLVEGMDEQRAIPELIEANGIAWGDRPADWIVAVVQAGGVSNLLAPAFIAPIWMTRR